MIERRRFALVLAAGMAAVACGPKSPPPAATLPPLAAPVTTPGQTVPNATPPPAPAPARPPDREPWRAQQPKVTALGRFTPPKVERAALKNGLTVLVVENHALPLVVVQLVVRGGSGTDPQGKAGLAALTANLLDEGAGSKNAVALAEALEALGTRLSTGADYDTSFAQVDGLKDKLAASVALLADVVLRPKLEASEVERVKAESAAELARLRQQGRVWSVYAARRAVFGDAHAYGRPPLGTEATLAKLGRDDVVAFHRDAWQPANAFFVVVGDITAAEAKKALEPRFGAWKAPAGAQPLAAAAPPPPAARAGRTVFLVDRPGAPQGDATIAFVGPKRGTPDWPALVVLNNALGGMFSSRLNMNLREDKGWTYGAFSRFEGRLETGMFFAGASLVVDKTAPGVAEALKELDGIKTRPPSGEELARAKDAEMLSMAGAFVENAQIAQATTTLAVYGLPLDYFAHYLEAVDKLTPGDVAAAARKYLHPDQAVIAVVGDPAKLEKELGKVAKVQKLEKASP